ncbi:hypothetical protein EGW08_018574 [Elysia chlorotica]|uniref:Uncharacterized protein n=1 Tax=Elysia chlorotica TaxID=188477 RepID=A0A433SWN9_ELYCH|nr:hypothetical protein EGW08_018574 [Elysia chlorotica]
MSLVVPPRKGTRTRRETTAAGVGREETTEEIAEKRRLDELEREERRRREEREHELAVLRIKAEHPGVADPAEATTKSNAKLPKLLSFVDYKDDLDSWLLRFERFAETSQGQKKSWPAYLSALLTGRALDCFCRLSKEDAKNYDAIKLALQKRYNLTEDGYHSMFRQCKPEEGENPGMFAVRLKAYLERWVKLSETEQTYDSLRDSFVREQFMDASPTDLSIHLREKRLRFLTSWHVRQTPTLWLGIDRCACQSCRPKAKTDQRREMAVNTRLLCVLSVTKQDIAQLTAKRISTSGLMFVASNAGKWGIRQKHAQ